MGWDNKPHKPVTAITMIRAASSADTAASQALSLLLFLKSVQQHQVRALLLPLYFKRQLHEQYFDKYGKRSVLPGPV